MNSGTAKEILLFVAQHLVPSCLRKNYITIDDAQTRQLEASIRNNYHQGWRNEHSYTSEAYAKDLRAHLTGRLKTDRAIYVPWINKTVPLKGANVLEIGCGTGSSTVALAEQGANVTAIDLDEGAVAVARERCEIYDVPATVICGSADDVYEDLRNQKFDLVLFFACMEHMLYTERIDSLRKYYDLLAEGSFLGIVETPNRLWHFDQHTSSLPHFHWLPDRVAFDYSRFSHRVNFRELYHEYSEEMFLHFLRRGRGFSFHELEIALNMRAEEFHVADYLRQPLLPNSLNSKFHKLLIRMNPEVSKGFFYSNVNIIIRKVANRMPTDGSRKT